MSGVSRTLRVSVERLGCSCCSSCCSLMCRLLEFYLQHERYLLYVRPSRPWGVAPHPNPRRVGRGAGRKTLPTPQPEGWWAGCVQGFASPVPPFVAASHDEPGARPLTRSTEEGGSWVRVCRCEGVLTTPRGEVRSPGHFQ